MGVTCHVTCQWCDSTDTYVSGYSPLCVETEYKCRECGDKTWYDFQWALDMGRGA